MPRAKDVSKPRGRISAYAYFTQVSRQEHKKKYPGEKVGFAEFARQCSGQWKTLSEKEKARFQEMAIRDKKRYELEMANYVPAKVEQGRGKKRKLTKDPNAPKRSLSAFFWFSGDQRSIIKGMNPKYGIGDIAKEIGRLWNLAEPEVRRKYAVMAEKDKARYEREMIAYKARVAAASAQNDDDDDEDDEESDENE